MANFRRRYPKCRQPAHNRSMSSWPSYWDLLYHRRPDRREMNRMVEKVLKGVIDADEAIYPLGNHKPHQYYW